MKTSEEYNPTERFTLLLLGRPGSGKTFLAAHFPDVYILDADNNLAGAATRLKKEGVSFLYDTPDIAADGTAVPPKERYGVMTECLHAAAADPNIGTIVVDSVSALNDYIIADIKRQQKINLMDNLRIQDWATVQYYWKHLIMGLKSSNKRIVFTAHTELVKDEINGEIFHQIFVQGGIRHQMAGLFSDVWLCQVQAAKTKNPADLKPEFTIRVVQSRQHLDLKTSILNLPGAFPADWNQIKKYL